MKRRFFTVTVVMLITAFLASSAWAISSGPPTEDSFVVSTEPNTPHNGQDLAVFASTTNCTPTYVSYLKWDLTGIPAGSTVQSAVMTLTSNLVTGTSGAMISLYETGDGWTETGITFNNAPAVGNLIETKAAPTSIGGTVVFNSGALATYINNQLNGDDVASFAIRFSSGCPSGVVGVRFEDRESASNKPDLQLQGPTAIALAKFEAVQSSFSNPAWLLAAALILLLGGGFLVYQRRLLKR